MCTHICTYVHTSIVMNHDVSVKNANHLYGKIHTYVHTYYKVGTIENHSVEAHDCYSVIIIVVVNS